MSSNLKCVHFFLSCCLLCSPLKLTAPTTPFEPLFEKTDPIKSETTGNVRAKKASEVETARGKPEFLPDGRIRDDDCEDKNENCSWWAEIGECEKNPG